MGIIKCIKILFQKALTLGTPSEKNVLYSEIIQKEVPKESAEKLTIKTAIGTIGNALKNTLGISEHEKGIEFGRGTPTPLPKMAKKEKTVIAKAVTKKPKTKETTVITKKTPAKTKSTTVKTETAKKPVTKKAAPKKTTEKKTDDTKTTGKTETKKSPAKKSVKKATTTKKAEKIALYTKDIQKHYGEVDSDFLAIIVKNLGPSIYKKDAELVSCSDPKELNTVRKNFLMKKLGIDASQKVLDAAIEDVCEELKSTRKKYRATFYYSLAKKFKKESVLS